VRPDRDRVAGHVLADAGRPAAEDVVAFHHHDLQACAAEAYRAREARKSATGNDHVGFDVAIVAGLNH
jgi:hypothetical protein